MQPPQPHNSAKSLVRVTTAATVGALVEFYDFYIFGSLATIISTKFFPTGNPTAAFLATLATFAAGLLVRPFGALFFGRLGDLIGRKYTFMVTIVLMGGATFAIGLIPTYQTIGFWAPIIVLVLRLLQGLAIGGEFGGAITFVAEHSPVNKRGFWTSWITMVGGFGFVVSFLVILVTKSTMTEASWEDWGWRIPFLLSLVLVFLSVIIRKNMSESPLFAKAKAEGKTSRNPLKDSFGKKENLKVVLLTIFGLMLGIGVVGYASTFFLQSFLVKFMFVDYDQANQVLIIGLTLGAPLYMFFGWLSDRVGRKPILMLSLFLGIAGFRPVFDQIYQTVNLEKKVENKRAMTVDVKKQPMPNNQQLNTTTIHHFYTDGTVCTEMKKQMPGTANTENTKSINISAADEFKLILLLLPLMIIVTMSAGPIGAFLVEMFPLKIRYTSLSLPYHVGYGIFGGLSPVISAYLISRAFNAHQPAYYLAGLNYAIILMSISLVIGLFYLKENRAEQAERIKHPAKKNRLKRILGFVWILLGLIFAYLGIVELGIPKIGTGKPDDLLFGIIVLFIVTPIITVGLVTFGKYALQGEYDDKGDL
jgi:MFS family permease